jgi:hypothetical protein
LRIRIISNGSIEGAADQRMVRRQLGVDPGQVENHGNLPDKMIVRYDFFKIE